MSRQTSMMSLQEKQLMGLEKRQKLFKEAALQVGSSCRVVEEVETVKEAALQLGWSCTVVNDKEAV